eukprot:gene4490-703_t
MYPSDAAAPGVGIGDTRAASGASDEDDYDVVGERRMAYRGRERDDEDDDGDASLRPLAAEHAAERVRELAHDC